LTFFLSAVHCAQKESTLITVSSSEEEVAFSAFHCCMEHHNNPFTIHAADDLIDSWDTERHFKVDLRGASQHGTRQVCRCPVPIEYFVSNMPHHLARRTTHSANPPAESLARTFTSRLTEHVGWGCKQFQWHHVESSMFVEMLYPACRDRANFLNIMSVSSYVSGVALV
jgi:hypothetical protein